MGELSRHTSRHCRTHTSRVACGLLPQDLRASAFQGYCAYLSGAEIAKYERIARESDRLLFVATHSLLRSLATFTTGMPIQEWTLTYDQKGQPFLTHEKSNQHWHATLTHTRGLVAAGISRSPIGVDAESMWMHWETVDELSYRYFTKREYKEIQLLPLADRNTRFLEIWTLKEAYLKACGTGLCGGLTSTCFSDVRHGYFEAKEMRPSSINPSPRISHYRINDYHLSVCSLSGSHVDVYRMTFGDGRWLATLPRLLAHRTTALGRWSTDFGQPTFEPAYSTQTKEKIG